MKEKFLPVGTVVMLKGGKKRLMITGFYVMDGEKKDKMYDYCGCLYPEGVVSADKNALFDHEQIEQIYYMGYADEEEKEFKSKLELALKSQNISNENQTQNIGLVQQTAPQNTIEQLQSSQSVQQQPTGVPAFNTLDLNQANNNNQ